MRSSREALPRLVLFGQENRENSSGLRRVAWVGRSKLHLLIVVVEFPEVLFALVFDHSEVVFAVRVVVRCELLKVSNKLENGILPIAGKLHESICQDQSASQEGLTAQVIECCNHARLRADTFVHTQKLEDKTPHF